MKDSKKRKKTNPNIMQKFSLITAFLLMFFGAAAQQGKVSGRVTGSDGQPLPGVNVSVQVAKAETDPGLVHRPPTPHTPPPPLYLEQLRMLTANTPSKIYRQELY